jgi:hypothetical protein
LSNIQKVRCIRILEYVGSPDWLKSQLLGSWVEPGEPKDAVGGIIKEVQRTIQPLEEDAYPPSPIDDEEIPF